MVVVERERKPGINNEAEGYPHALKVGPIGRLGRFTASHFRVVPSRSHSTMALKITCRWLGQSWTGWASPRRFM